MTPPPMPKEFINTWQQNSAHNYETAASRAEDLWHEAMKLLPPLTAASLLALPRGVETAREIARDGFFAGTRVHHNQASYCAAWLNDNYPFPRPPRTTKRVRAFVELQNGTNIWWDGSTFRTSDHGSFRSAAQFCAVKFNGERCDEVVVRMLALKTAPLTSVPLDHWAEEVRE